MEAKENLEQKEKEGIWENLTREKEPKGERNERETPVRKENNIFRENKIYYA